MGIHPTKQQMDKLKIESIDLFKLRLWLAQIKSEEDIEAAIKALLSIMTIKQKLGQMQQVSYGEEKVTPELQKQIANGGVGSFLNMQNIDVVNEVQKISMQQSRLKIPQLIGKDVIHGFRTVLPIPLAQAASFNPDLVQAGSRVAAIECSSTGVRWTFTPMVDIARDPRWGRIAQGFGEDPYLASQMGTAVMRGFQTQNLKDITAVAACGKHFVGYGATEGGRDYNTTLIPQNILRDVYLAPFQALSDGGCLSFMSAFNDLNGQPSSANSFILEQVLRKEWKFKGLVVSDYNAVAQLINHGFAQNQAEAAEKACNASLDMEMVSTCFNDNLQSLLNSKKCSIQKIDSAVSNILRVKFKLGLFENYYTDPARQKIILDPKHLQAAKNLAVQCPVLLQNKNKSLPLSNSINSLAVIGALADDPENQLGCWVVDGKASDTITPLTSLKAALPKTKINYAPGYKDTRSSDTSLFSTAIEAAQNSQKVLLFVGQDNGLTGQSNCRAYLNIPGCQELLIQQIAKTKKPIILIVYSGRSLLLEPLLPLVDSILYVWQLGTMAGPALTDLLLGTVSPSGKLPITFLRAVGQIPLYYNKKNTGRPNNTHNYIPFTSSYIDIDSTPLFSYGFGLSYTTFTYSNLKISRQTIKPGQTLLISATVKNDGGVKADQTVFLFVRDLVGSYTRPVKQLKSFTRVTLNPNESTTVTFTLSDKNLAYWTKDKVYKAEPGKFKCWIAKNAQEGLETQFQLVSSASKQFETLE